jgi:hypothetical protein
LALSLPAERAVAALRAERRREYGVHRMVKNRPMWHLIPMNTAFLIISSLALLTLGIGGIATFFAVRSAPEGFEDADGFHLVANSKSPASVTSTSSHDLHPEGARFAA